MRSKALEFTSVISTVRIFAPLVAYIPLSKRGATYTRPWNNDHLTLSAVLIVFFIPILESSGLAPRSQTSAASDD